MPFLRWCHLVGDLLVLLKGPEPGTLYVGVVDENVPAPVVRGDEAVALLPAEPLDRSLDHMLEPAFLFWGSTATKKPPLSNGRRLHQNKTHLLLHLEHTISEDRSPVGESHALFTLLPRGWNLGSGLPRRG
jgi:hypothetical protein